MPYTLRKQLYKPDPGETGYDVFFSESMDTIDADAAFKDLEEKIEATWTFLVPPVLAPESQVPPFILGENAKGKEVPGLNAEQVGGRSASLLALRCEFSAATQDAAQTFYYLGAKRETNEADAQYYMPRGKLRALYLRVSSNGLNGVVSFAVRKNAAGTALAITVDAGATGKFSKVEEVDLERNDLVSVRVDTSAATSGSLTFQLRLEWSVEP